MSTLKIVKKSFNIIDLIVHPESHLKKSNPIHRGFRSVPDP